MLKKIWNSGASGLNPKRCKIGWRPSQLWWGGIKLRTHFVAECVNTCHVKHNNDMPPPTKLMRGRHTMKSDAMKSAKRHPLETLNPKP